MSPLERWIVFQVTGRRPRRSPRKARRGPARNWKYRAWVRTLPCAACGESVGIQAAHTGDDGGMSMKASDYSCVPLCFGCHREYDNGKVSGPAFEQRHAIEMRVIVRRLNSLWFECAGRVK